MRRRHRYLIFPKETQRLGLVKNCPTLKWCGSFYTLDLYEDVDLDLIKALDDTQHAIIKEYTEEELDAAPWLCASPRWSDYFPYPNGYIKQVYKRLRSCKNDHDLVQVDDFQIDKVVKKMEMPFLELNYVHDEIFLANSVRKSLESSALKGFGFRNVWVNSRKKLQPNLSQLTIDAIIPPVFDFSKMEIEFEDTCTCGTKRRQLKQGSPLVLKRQVIDNIKDIDIFKTSEYFGQGGIWMRMIFISHRFYETLKALGVEDALSLELPDHFE